MSAVQLKVETNEKERNCLVKRSIKPNEKVVIKIESQINFLIWHRRLSFFFFLFFFGDSSEILSARLHKSFGEVIDLNRKAMERSNLK